MSEPDLSFLDPAGRQPAPTGHAPGTPTPRATPPSTGAEGLVAELRAYQAELEAQNKVLQYSQAAAESPADQAG